MFDFDATETFSLLVLVPNVEFDVATPGDLTEPDATLDPLAWNAATNYALDAQVYYVKRIYSRVVAGVSATAPDLDAVNWIYVSLCNRFKQFDALNSTQTVAPAGASVNYFYRIKVAAGDTFDTLVFDNLEGISALRVRVYDNTGAGATLNDSSRTLVGYDATRLWARRKTWVLHNQDGDDPLGTVVRVDVTKQGSEVPKIGSFSLGLKRELGVPLSGFNVGIVDRTVKDTDEFGNISVIERTFTKRMSGTLAVESSALDAVANLLADYRAQPSMYIATGGTYSAMTMLGYYKSFEVTVIGDELSYCFIDVEGI